MPHTIVYLALGSNLGDRRVNLTRALDALQLDPAITVTAVSPIYETAPVGGPEEQPNYYNAAARIETTLTPEQLLDRTQHVECRQGRRRTVPNAPRTIDIDILLYADLVRPSPDPILPHPRMHHRPFVLRPLADVAPDARHPVFRQPVRELARSLEHPTDVLIIHDSKWWPGER